MKKGERSEKIQAAIDRVRAGENRHAVAVAMGIAPAYLYKVMAAIRRRSPENGGAAAQ